MSTGSERHLISYCISIGCSVVVGCKVVTSHRRYWQNFFARLWRRPPLNWSHGTMIARWLSFIWDCQRSVCSCLKQWDQFLSFTLLFTSFFPGIDGLSNFASSTLKKKKKKENVTAYTPLGPTIVTVLHDAFCLSLHSVCLHSCVALFSNTLEGPSAQVSSLSCSKNCQNDGTTARAKQRWKTAGKGGEGEINQSTCGQTLHNYIT